VVFKKFTLIILILALLLNFVWEMLQMPLYTGMKQNMQSIIFCALASVADAIMVLLLYYSFALIYKESFWVRRLISKRIALLMIASGLGAVLAEMIHLSQGNWAYAESMPLLPVVNVGLIPVLQFIFLPAFICYLSFVISRKLGSKSVQ
jgi:hypothetical protein